MSLMKMIVLAAVLTAAGSARAQSSAYTARCTALTDFVNSKPLADVDKVKALAAVKTYCAAHAACLDQVRGALARKFEDKIEWPGCVGSPPVKELGAAFDGLIVGSTVKPAVAEEEAFYQGLNGALKTVAEARGEVATGLADVVAYTGKVRDREWPQVLQYAQVFCDSLGRVRSTPLYESAINATRDAVVKTSSSLKGAILKFILEKLTDIPPEVIDAIVADLEVATTKWLAERSSGRMNLVQAAMYGGGGTMSLYVTLKEMSTTFIASYKGRDLKTAGAEAALDRFVSSASAPGQADDAKVLSGLLKAELVKLAVAYQAAVNTFTVQHEDNVRNLKDKVACTSEWKALQSKVRSESAISMLNEWRRQTIDYFGVDMQTYRDQIQRRIGSRMSAVAAALEREAAAEVEDQRLVDEGVRQAERF